MPNFHMLKNYILFALWMCLAQAAQAEGALSAGAIQAATPLSESLGLKVAADLNRRYLDTRLNCSNEADPAFKCSGVLFRGTRQGNYHVWNNSPLSITKGGVSFSYLRQDVSFSRLAYGYTNGYIFTASNDAGSTKTIPEVLCSFPIDGHTNQRSGTGCGPYPNKPRSNLCWIENISSAAEWIQAYGSAIDAQTSQSQCGFDLSDPKEHPPAPAFSESLRARVGLGEAGYQMHNEIVIRTWPENIGASLPLEAFFYIEGSAPGLAEAQHNQKDLKTTDNVTIPIIKIKLPTSELRPVWTINAPATFEYVSADQSVAIPGEPLVLDESQMLLNGVAIYVNWPLSGVDALGNTAVRTVKGGRAPYTYTSSNPAIVSVTAAGKAQGRANGTTRIVVKDANNSSISYPVKVENVYLLRLSPTKYNASNAVNWIVANGGVAQKSLVNTLIKRLKVMYKLPMPNNGNGWVDRRGEYFSFIRPSGHFSASVDGSNLFFAWAFIPKKP